MILMNKVCNITVSAVVMKGKGVIARQAAFVLKCLLEVILVSIKK